MSKPRLLFLGDESGIPSSAAAVLTRLGYQVEIIGYGSHVAETLMQREIEVAVIDHDIPDADAASIADSLARTDPDLQIIVLTDNNVLEPQTSNNYSFQMISQPVDVSTLVHIIKFAADHRRVLMENHQLARHLEMQAASLRNQLSAAKRALERHLAESQSLIGNSQCLAEIRQFIAAVAPEDCSVLIRGETGTEKNAVARMIHEYSDRKCTGDFHKINCRAMLEPMLEAELFGHEEGALIGADRKKPGRLELSDGGTVFFEEIAEMPLHLQSRLLQVIDHKQFMRVGGSQAIPVDVRIMAATNAPLEGMIAAGRFRADLYYRLIEHCITLAPLRERMQDIPLLAQHFLERFSGHDNGQESQLTEDSLQALMHHSWPENVYELENVIRHYAEVRNEDILRHLSPASSGGSDIPAQANAHAVEGTLIEMEVQTLLKALSEARWNQRQAAKNLGLSYSALRRRIAKHRLKDVKQRSDLKPAMALITHSACDGLAGNIKA